MEKIEFKNFKLMSGMTLLELIVSFTIGSFIIFGGASIMLNLKITSTKFEKINQIESDIHFLEATLKSIALSGVNVRYFNEELDGTQGSFDGAGFVRSFEYTQDASMGTMESKTIMYFAREVTLSSLNTPLLMKSVYRPTGVFFRKKNETYNKSTHRSGQLIIDMGSSNTPGSVSPDDGDIVFNNISDVIFDLPQFTEGNVLTGIRVRVKIIYPLLSVSAGFECFGPTKDIENGLTCLEGKTLEYAFKEKSFFLNFQNNKRHTFLSSAEFQNGMYLFNLTSE